MYRAFMLQLSACKVSNNAFMIKQTKRFIVLIENKLKCWHFITGLVITELIPPPPQCWRVNWLFANKLAGSHNSIIHHFNLTFCAAKCKIKLWDLTAVHFKETPSQNLFHVDFLGREKQRLSSPPETADYLINASNFRTKKTLEKELGIIARR